MSEARFPLSWPPGWRRTPAADRRRGRFRSATPGASFLDAPVTINDALGRLFAELGRLGVVVADPAAVIVSTNLIVGRHGRPLSDQKAPADPGAAVYWNDGAGAKAMACDLYDRTADNLAAIAATLEAMRAIERHGGAEILTRVFTGFEALPAPRSHWDILHILPTQDRETIERAFRVRALRVHPDHGGTAAAFDELTKARAAALEGLRGI